MDDTGTAWERLGRLLIARRVELGFPNRSAFARHLGMSHDRTLADLEKARRQNFDETTLLFVENGYGWQAGSIREVLAGGDPILTAADRQRVMRRALAELHGAGEPTVTEENPEPEAEVDRRPVGLGLDDAAEGLTAEDIQPVLEVIRLAKRAKGLAE